MDIKMMKAVTDAMLTILVRLEIIEKLLADNNIASENWMCMLYEQKMEKIENRMQEIMKDKNNG